MANRIKGITVEIGGDTTGLDKALQGVNKTIKDTQSQLKDVERLLKLDPSNTELLNQKQKLLKESISATKDKLDALKNAQEQAKKQLESGDLGQEKYDALQREIIETEQQLEKLEEKAKRSSVALNKISEAGKKIQDVGGKVTAVGTSLAKNVTAPIVAVGAAAMAAFSEVDGAMDTLITKTGASGEALDKMSETVTNLATTIPTDFQTAANAVGEVSTRFDDIDDVGDNLEELSGQFIKFASINNIDVTTAIDNVQASMAAFEVDTSDAGLVLDTLNHIGQQTGTDMNQLTGLMLANAGVAKEMGMSYEDTANFLGNLNKNGVDASSVMTGLKKAWQTASKNGKSMQSTLTELNSKMINAATDTEAYQAAIEVFGAKAGPAIAQAVREGRLSLDEFNISMSSFSGNVEDTFSATLDPIDQTTITMNEVKATGAELSTTMQELLLPILRTLNEKLKEFREWWAGLNDDQKQTIVKIAAIVAAIGPLLVVLGKVVSFIGTIMTMAPALGGVIAALSGPVGIVIAIIAALVAAGVLLYKNWDTIKEKGAKLISDMKEKWTSFKTFMSGLLQWLKDETSRKWDETKQAIIDKVTSIKTNVTDKFSAMKESISQKISDIKESAVSKFDSMKESITDKFSAMKDSVLDKFTAIKDGIKEKIDAAKEFVHEAVEKIKGFFNFHIELPHISLPHFSIQPPGWQLGDLLHGVIPSLSIDWYAKAMDNGMILNHPTIFGLQNGKLLAGGEAGSETVVGTNSLMSMVRAAVESASSLRGDLYVYVISNGTSAAEISDEIAVAISQKLRMSGSW